MGKWTLRHHDDVLLQKFKSLVSGSVKRLSQEREDNEPSISYETFVEKLDEGDSFTAMMIEILVREIADRQNRPDTDDRRLISERTAKSLRLQTAPLRIFHNRRPRRIHNRRAWFTLDPGMDTALYEEEDDTGADARSAHSEFDVPFEGARLNTDLYDAYTRPVRSPSPFSDLSAVRPSEPTPLATGSPNAAETSRAILVTSPRPLSPPALPSASHRLNPPPFNSFSAGGAALARQNSVRRLPRGRAMDFSEFTQRRRSSARQSQHESDTVRPEDLPDATWRFRSTTHDLNEPLSTQTTLPIVDTRGLYLPPPNSLWTPLRHRHEVGGAFPWSPRSSQSPPLEDSYSAQLPAATSSGQSPWYPAASASSAAEPSLPSSSRRASIADINEARRQVIAPRLRRGGVRAPESLLSRYASPAVENSHGSTNRHDTTDASAAGSTSWVAQDNTVFARYRLPSGSPMPGSADLGRTGDLDAQLPTPARSNTPLNVTENDTTRS